MENFDIQAEWIRSTEKENKQIPEQEGDRHNNGQALKNVPPKAHKRKSFSLDKVTSFWLFPLNN